MLCGTPVIPFVPELGELKERKEDAFVINGTLYEGPLNLISVFWFLVVISFITILLQQQLCGTLPRGKTQWAHTENKVGRKSWAWNYIIQL